MLATKAKRPPGKATVREAGATEKLRGIGDRSKYNRSAPSIPSKAVALGYTKLDENLVTSSIWSEDDKTLRVWVYLMARAGPNGAILDTIPAIARACGYDIPTTKGILDKLAAPDEYSRTPDLDGRRIAILHEPEFAIHLVNHAKYRSKAHSAAERKRAQRSRDRHDASRGVTRGHAVSPKQKHKQKQKTEALRTTEAPAAPDAPATIKATDWNREAADDFREAYRADPPKLFFAQVKAVAQKYGWARTRPALKAYMGETPIEFLNVAKCLAVKVEGGGAPIRGKPKGAEGNTAVLDEWMREVQAGRR